MKKLFLLVLLVSPAFGQTFAGTAGSDIFIPSPFRFCMGVDNFGDNCATQSKNQEMQWSGSVDFKWAFRTVGTLPAASALNLGRTYEVTDGQSNTDCTSGGGSALAICTSNGSTWNALGASGSGSGSGGVPNTLPNCTATGTTLNSGVSFSTQVVSSVTTLCAQTAAVSSNVVVGVATSGAGTSGNVSIAYSGYANCIFDNQTTQGDYVVASASNAGQCSDIGSGKPGGTVEVIGIVASTNTGGGTLANVLVNPLSLYTPGGTNNSGNVNNASQFRLPFYSGSGNTNVLSGDSNCSLTSGFLTGCLGITIGNGGTTGAITYGTGSEPSLPASGNGTTYIDSSTNQFTCVLYNGTSCTPGPYVATASGMKCDGSTDDTSAFNTLLSTISTTQATIQFPLGKKCVIGTATVPSNVMLDFSPGAAISEVTSHTLSIEGGISNPDSHQIFYNAYASQGTVDPTTSNTQLKVVYPEWWGAVAGGNATTNHSAIQAAIIGAFGSNRTNGSGLAIWNKELRFSGQYAVNGTLNVYHMVGFVWSCGSRLNCGLIETGSNTTLINGQSVAYGVFRDMSFSTNASQSTSFPLVNIDYNASQGSDLAPQFIDFDHDNFIGAANFASAIGVEIARSGGGAQGNNVVFTNTVFQLFGDTCLMIGLGTSATHLPTNSATNAINIKVQNGDFQGCRGDGVANYGGGFVDINLVTFEDGFDSVISGSGAQTGYDMFCYPSVNAESCSAENVRSESMWLLGGTSWQVNNVYNLDLCKVLVPGATPPVGGCVQGSDAADGVYYQVSGSTSAAGGLGTNSSPLTATGGSATTIVDSVGGFTVNAWTGWQVSYVGGTTQQYCVITSNTANTFTCSAGWQDHYYNQTPTNPVNGTHYFVEPNWGTQTTSGGITWTAFTKHDMDCAACGGIGGSITTAFGGGPLFVPGVQIAGFGSTQVESTRADAVVPLLGQSWFTFNGGTSNAAGYQFFAGDSGSGAGGGGGNVNVAYIRKPVFYSTNTVGTGPQGNTSAGSTNGLSALRGEQTTECWLGGPSNGANALGTDICTGAQVGPTANTGAWYVENSSATAGTSPGKRMTFDPNGNLNVANSVAALNVSPLISGGSWQRMGTVIPATSTCSYATIEGSLFRRQGAKVLTGVPGTQWIWAAIFTCGFTSSTIDYSESITGAPGTWTTPQSVTGIPANHAHGRLATNTDGSLYNNGGTYYFTACNAPINCTQIDSFSTTDLFSFSSVANGIYTNGAGWDSGDHLGNSRFINDAGTLYLITEAQVSGNWKAAVNTGGTVSGSWTKPGSPQLVNGAGTLGNEFIVKSGGVYYAFEHGGTSSTPSDGFLASAVSMTTSSWTIASTKFLTRSTVDEGVSTTLGQVSDFSLYQSTGGDGLPAGQVYMLYDAAPNQSPAAASPGIHLNLATSTQSFAQLVLGPQGNGTAEASYFNHLSAGTIELGQTAPNTIDIGNSSPAATTDQAHLTYYTPSAGNQALSVGANLYVNNGVTLARNDTTMSGVRFGLDPSTTQANTGFFVQFMSTGGTLTTPLSIGSDGSGNSTTAFSGSVSISDQGTCTMSSGACTAVNLSRTYSAAPACVATWNGTGTLTGIVKAVSSTTQITISSSVGTDTAHMNWACFGG